MQSWFSFFSLLAIPAVLAVLWALLILRAFIVAHVFPIVLTSLVLLFSTILPGLTFYHLSLSLPLSLSLSLSLFLFCKCFARAYVTFRSSWMNVRVVFESFDEVLLQITIPRQIVSGKKLLPVIRLRIGCLIHLGSLIPVSRVVVLTNLCLYLFHPNVLLWKELPSFCSFLHPLCMDASMYVKYAHAKPVSLYQRLHALFILVCIRLKHVLPTRLVSL